MSTSRQLIDLIKNKSRKINISAQLLLRRYFMEKLLERISKSEYSENFILKGGILVSSLIGINLRATNDIDFTIKNIYLNEENIAKILVEVSKIENDDNIIFTLDKIQEIREGQDYPGTRVFFNVSMDQIKERVHLDITTGDSITPQEIVYNYKLILEDRKINLYAYPIETVLAEKIETILSRNITNTRARDYYDCYMLEKLFTNELNYSNLAVAIENTIVSRNSRNVLAYAYEILHDISNDSKQLIVWQKYQSDNLYEEKIEFSDAIESIYKLLKNAHIL